MIPPFYGGLRLGILGGGQLGRMMLSSCVDFNVDTSVLDPDPQAPARPYVHRFECGDFRDAQTLIRFGRGLDILTLEIEDVATDGLRELAVRGVRIHPSAEVVALIQDKGAQKQFYVEEGIPTSPYILIDNRENLEQHTTKLPAILKLRRGGYDGRGVLSVKDLSDVPESFNAPCILEEKVSIAHEISVVAARNPQGQTCVYPAVDMVFDPQTHVVQYLYAPAQLPPTLLKEAEDIALHLVERLGVVGLLAVEFFVDSKGRLLVNEMAPRPHNSGHHTIEANMTSQFEQHLRAVLGLPLGSTALRLPAVMLNLLGADDATGSPRYEGIEAALATEGVKLHLYGKQQVRPGRKMGHLTIIDQTLEAALIKAKRFAETVRVVAAEK